MVFSLSVLAVVLSLASAAPLNNREDIEKLDNSIDVDERPSKQVRAFSPWLLLSLWLAMAWFNDCQTFERLRLTSRAWTQFPLEVSLP